MEREQDRWKRLYAGVCTTGGGHPTLRHTHPDSLIVGVFLWAALNERPVYWACQKSHWPAAIRPRVLPSQACMSRRLRSCPVLALLERAYAALREALPAGMLKFIDAKPLPVGGCSKDRDALYGRAAGGKAKGYKFYAVVDAQSGVVEAWRLGPMSYAEQNAATHLLPHLPAQCLTVGDKVYDSMRLYDQAQALDQFFLARFPVKATGKAHQRQSPARLEALVIAHTSAGAALIEARNTIERTFAHFTSTSGGLLGLPSWVRTPHRVAVWVAAKLLIDLDRRHQLFLRKELAA